MISLLYSKKKNGRVWKKEASFSSMEIEIVQLCGEPNSVTYLFKKIKCSHLCRNLSQD